MDTIDKLRQQNQEIQETSNQIAQALDNGTSIGELSLQLAVRADQLRANVRSLEKKHN